MRTGEDANTVLNYLDVSGFGEEKAVCLESRNALVGYELDYVLENHDLRQHLIRLLCFLHFHDVQVSFYRLISKTFDNQIINNKIVVK